MIQSSIWRIWGGPMSPARTMRSSGNQIGGFFYEPVDSEMGINKIIAEEFDGRIIFINYGVNLETFIETVLEESIHAVHASWIREAGSDALLTDDPRYPVAQIMALNVMSMATPDSRACELYIVNPNKRCEDTYRDYAEQALERWAKRLTAKIMDELFFRNPGAALLTQPPATPVP